MKESKKAQLSLINIVFFLIIVVLGAVVTPIMSGFITDLQNTTNLTTTSTIILNSIVPVFWLGVVITFFLYVAPVRPQQY